MSMCQSEAYERPACQSIPCRSHCAHQTRQHNQALTPRLDGFSLRVEQCVGICFFLDRAIHFLDRELIPEPTIVRTRDEAGILQQPEIGIGVTMCLNQSAVVK